jgi:transposase-like protein
MELDSEIQPISSCKRKRISAFIFDETVIQFGRKNYYLWKAIESLHKTLLGIHISEERKFFLLDNFCNH